MLTGILLDFHRIEWLRWESELNDIFLELVPFEHASSHWNALSLGPKLDYFICKHIKDLLLFALCRTSTKCNVKYYKPPIYCVCYYRWKFPKDFQREFPCEHISFSLKRHFSSLISFFPQFLIVDVVWKREISSNFRSVRSSFQESRTEKCFRNECMIIWPVACQFSINTLVNHKVAHFSNTIDRKQLAHRRSYAFYFQFCLFSFFSRFSILESKMLKTFIVFQLISLFVGDLNGGKWNHCKFNEKIIANLCCS